MGCAFLSLPLSLGASYERNAREASCHAPSQPTTPLRNGPWCHCAHSARCTAAPGSLPDVAFSLPLACLRAGLPASHRAGRLDSRHLVAAPAGRRHQIIDQQAHHGHTRCDTPGIANSFFDLSLWKLGADNQTSIETIPSGVAVSDLIAVLPSPAAVRHSASQPGGRGGRVGTFSCQPKYQGW